MHSDNSPYSTTPAEYRVTTRTSNLALRQVEEVARLVPELRYSIVPVESFGDKNKQISLIENNISDIFTRELDFAILNGDADFAIHSAKDLPYPLPEGLEIIALTEAFDKTDALVSYSGKKLTELPANPKLGTSSILRKAELLRLRPDIEIVSIRGTIEERIAQVDNGKYDAGIVATCALKRLGLEHRIAEILPFETHPLQGHLAIVAKQGNTELKKLFMPFDIRTNYRSVWLVGFGPGDPDLLTLKGHKLLQHADIIYYDDLTNHRFLDEFGAEKVYVGKRKDAHSFEQDEINKLLYQSAIQGKNVVRLKGGDPMTFAHGGEEVDYLASNLVDVHVVPGITTALAAAASAGVPLTHRSKASSVTFLTGHTPEEVVIPQKGTVVIYMGASNIQSIAQKAIDQGRKSETPVMLSFNVSKPDEEVEYSTLQQISTSARKYKTPLIVTIGEVAGHHPNRNATKAKPSYLITGTKQHVANPFNESLHIPLVEIKPVPEDEAPDLLPFLSATDWLVFTSRYTVRYFFELLHKQGSDARVLSGLKIASIGKVTSAELLKHGIIPDMQPKLESSVGVIERFAESAIHNQRIFIPRSNLALPVLPEGLTKLGNHVATAVIYHNTQSEVLSIPHPDKFDIIVFSSPSGVDNFFDNVTFSLANKQFIARGSETRRRLLEKAVNANNILNSDAYETLS
ncbi:MAG TPA: uroporphyrinogen-III C-methyltransferase [Bacteroidales bacterium]|nr:uroporphyrinogen-III C-methyltransferase [Bacteroidales bacterium]